jgi:hypothetical protein
LVVPLSCPNTKGPGGSQEKFREWLLANSDSVLYDPHDGGAPIVLPGACARHPGGIEGWLKEINHRADERNRDKLLARLFYARRMVLTETAEGWEFSLDQIRDSTGVPVVLLDAVAQLRGMHFLSYRCDRTFDEVIEAIRAGAPLRGIGTVDDDDDDEDVEGDEVANRSPRKARRETEQREKRIKEPEPISVEDLHWGHDPEESRPIDLDKLPPAQLHTRNDYIAKLASLLPDPRQADVLQTMSERLAARLAI